MTDFPIDIVIPWVNSNDPHWQNDFKLWRFKESGNTSECRFRDWGFIRYVLRSIDKNCPWCNNVIIVMSSPTQVPCWLNTNNPKLRVVYHPEYIPAKYLPTFNSNVIEMFFYRIPGLAEHFISCNDDMIFTQPLPKRFFFENGLPVCKRGIKPIYNGEWDCMLSNCIDLADKLVGGNQHIMYDTFHLPVSYIKSLQSFLMGKIQAEFDVAFKNSRFRLPKNLTHLFFHDMQCKLGMCHFTDEYRGTYFRLDHVIELPRLYKSKMVCLNENEFTNAAHIMRAIKVLEVMFDKKSSFEV